MRAVTVPAILGALAGVTYQEFAAPPIPVPLERDGAVVGEAHGWIDALEPGAATVVLGYRHPHYGRWAAVTRNAVGAGEITVVGTLPDRASLARVIADAAAIEPSSSGLVIDRPSSVTVHSLAGARGRIWVLHNWSGEPREIRLARAVASVIVGATHKEGDVVALAAWDVRVWREV